MLLKSFWNLQYYIIFIIFYQCSKFFRTISWSLHTPPVWERVVRDPTFLVTYKTSEPCTSRCTFEVKRGLIPKDSVTPLTLHHVSLVQSNSSRAEPAILAAPSTNPHTMFFTWVKVHTSAHIVDPSRVLRSAIRVCHPYHHRCRVDREPSDQPSSW